MNNQLPSPGAPQPRLWALGFLAEEVVKEATEAHEARANGKPCGPVTGLSRLDSEIGGYLPKSALTMILGNSGSGKTALCSQIAAGCGCPALYLTTEMSPVELLRRHTARVTSTFLGRLKSGEMAPREVERLVCETAQKCAALSIVDATMAYASPAYLQERIVEAKERGEAKHAVLVVDSLHTWARGNGVSSGDGEMVAINEHLLSLGRLAKQTASSVVVICEQNRAAIKEAKENPVGNMNSGAGSRFIEYSADLILDLFASKTQDGAGEKAVKLTIAKNRNGAPDKPIDLLFNGALQRFQEKEGVR